MTKIFKKSLAFVIALALLVPCLIVPGMVGATDDELDIWDGTYDVQPSDADGDGVLEIYTPEELAWFVKNLGRTGSASTDPAASAKLMNDIWLNDMIVTVEDGVPTATKATDTNVVIDLNDDENCGLNEWFDGTRYDADTNFVGTLDGNNHVVNGLYIKHNEEYSSNYYGAGLIPGAGEGCTVVNVGIENSYMSTTADYTSAFIVGNVQYGKATVKNCYVGASNYHTGKKASAIVGGGARGALVKDCYNLATIVKDDSAISNSGYIVGDSWGNEDIYNCYTVNGYKIIRPGYESHSHESYSFTAVPNKEDIPYLGGAYLLEAGKYPVLRSFVEDADKGWNGLQEIPYDFDGDGLLEIANASAFYYATLPGTQQKNFEITDDIIFNDITVKIENGVGVIYDANGNKVEDYSTLNKWHTAQDTVTTVKYYGNNHIIRGIVSDDSSNYHGLVNVGWDVDFYDIGIEDMYIAAKWGGAAAFIGSIDYKTFNDVEGCYVAESVYLSGYHAAGVFANGRSNGSGICTVKNFYILATLDANASGKKGAITGYVTLCENYTVDNTYATTEFWGVTQGKTANSYSNVDISKMQGLVPLLDMPNLGSAFVTTEKYPTLKAFIGDLTEANKELGVPVFDGAGTQEEPYLVSNATQLKVMVGTGGNGAYYKLTNDIYVNDVNAVNWLTGDVNDGYDPEEWFASDLKNGNGYTGYISDNQQFSGTIDGDGYAIHGLYYALGNAHTAVGLLPYVSSAVVTNLGIEDSYIAGGRFIGGMIGNTASSATVTISGCYIDNSCKVRGYDAGAAHVTSANDVSASSGKLCVGNLSYSYSESANGTYYYDETSSTYLLITDDSYTGTRYVRNNVWNNVNFNSEALGGLVGNFGVESVATIKNSFATAAIENSALRAFGFNSQGVTFLNEGSQGVSIPSNHTGGLWGDDYNATVTAIDCFSEIYSHYNINEGKTTFTNVYYRMGSHNAGTAITPADPRGADGLSKMPGLDPTIWYAVKVDGAYPSFRLRGTVIGDVNEDGQFQLSSDAAALRVVIMDNTAVSNGDFNRNGKVNICDLVALSK